MQKGQLALKEISEYLISPADGVQSTAVGLHCSRYKIPKLMFGLGVVVLLKNVLQGKR